MSVKHSQGPGDDGVLEDGAVGNVDDVIGVGGDQDPSAQRDVLAKVHVARHGQVVEADQVGHVLQAPGELLYLKQIRWRWAIITMIIGNIQGTSIFWSQGLDTECVNTSVSMSGKKLLWKFPRTVGHTTAAGQPGKKKIERTSLKKQNLQKQPNAGRCNKNVKHCDQCRGHPPKGHLKNDALCIGVKACQAIH